MPRPRTGLRRVRDTRAGALLNTSVSGRRVYCRVCFPSLIASFPLQTGRCSRAVSPARQAGCLATFIADATGAMGDAVGVAAVAAAAPDDDDNEYANQRHSSSIPTVGFNLKRVQKGHVTLKWCVLSCSGRNGSVRLKRRQLHSSDANPICANVLRCAAGTWEDSHGSGSCGSDTAGA